MASKAGSAGDGHVASNRELWTGYAPQYAGWAPRNWARRAITWGVWRTPERKLQVLGDVSGQDVIDLGCGTGYFSAWLARRGARPVGLDITPAQLATARAMQRRFGLRFPLVEASAEDVPLRDERFDLAISEYGASIWCNPERWIPEAARLLRPGGRLAFLRNATICVLTYDELGNVGRELQRDYFGLGRLEWPDDHSVEWQPGYGDWIRILRGNGLQVERLIEIRAPAGATWRGPPEYAIDPDWARRWPTEEIWVATKTG
jgi:SAM-dependent methyltransferase